MALPAALRHDVERALARSGLGRSIRAVTEVGGGCINHGSRLETDEGASCFLKWNAAAPPGLFEREAEGLAALGRVGAVRVPAVLARGGGDGAPAWLLLEYVPPTATSRRSDERLGRGLAAIHAHAGGDRFGWAHDNWIGSLPQANDHTESWGVFWRDRRIAPHLAAARARGHLRDRVLDRVVDVVPAALADVTRPELLHGDLWSGNAYATGRDEPVLVDPAVYRGDGEVDLAMSELFGGFGPAFYDAYREARGVDGAYDAWRRDLYQLHYLLVHVVLFGASYVPGTLRAAERVLAALT